MYKRQLVAAEVVLADGRVVECDEERLDDLFWALRGAGGRYWARTHRAARARSVIGPGAGAGEEGRGRGRRALPPFSDLRSGGDHRATPLVQHRPRGRVTAAQAGGYEEGLRGGGARGNKALVGDPAEVRGRGSGRLRLQVLKDTSGDSPGAFVTGTTRHGRGRAHPWPQRLQRPARARPWPRPAPPGRRPERAPAPTRTARSRTSRPRCTAPTAEASPQHLPVYLDGSSSVTTGAPDDRLPGAARTRRPPRAVHLPRHHRPSRLTHR